jgi:hypothetical protein
MNAATLVWVACIFATVIRGGTQTDQRAAPNPVPVAHCQAEKYKKIIEFERMLWVSGITGEGLSLLRCTNKNRC